MIQTTLFPEAAVVTPKTIQEKFEEYDRNHPEVWDLFVRFAWEARDAGRDRYSARAIIHRIRWECAIENPAGDAFKINDHLAGRYARKLIGADPDKWEGFFELRN